MAHRLTRLAETPVWYTVAWLYREVFYEQG